MIPERSILVRQFSRRAVTEALLHHGPISRVDLARRTGLSKQTMSDVILALEGDGWVVTAGTKSGHVGRTAVLYQIAESAAYSLGVDLGGTKVIAALADLMGDIVAEATEPTDPRGGRSVIEQIGSLAARLAKEAGIESDKIHSVVVGTPGVVDPKSGAIVLVPNIKGFSEIDVTGALNDLFSAKVTIENDVNLAMLGEAWQGSAQGCENAAFLALGTGVGLGLMVNGKLVRGATGAAGEVAYLPIGRDTSSPEARMIGAFELEVGAAGIVRRYHAAGGSAATRTVRGIFESLAAGDAVADALLDETAAVLSGAIVALHTVLDPEVIVLGGSIGIRVELIERVQRQLPLIYDRPVRLQPTDLGSRAGLVGAVSSAVNRLHNEIFGIPNLPGELALPAAALPKAAE